jgi:hypothetical protein
MQLFSRALIILLICSFAVPRVAAQQSHVVDQQMIQKAFDQRAAEAAAKRQVIRSALQQPDVVKVANRLGLDIARAEAAVATLDGAELNQLAAQAATVNDELSGGQNVTLNLIWIIIGLLVLILLIVAVD